MTETLCSLRRLHSGSVVDYQMLKGLLGICLHVLGAGRNFARCKSLPSVCTYESISKHDQLVMATQGMMNSPIMASWRALL